MSALACDIRYALRLFGKNLGVTVLSTLVLAFGIGGVTMMFSLVSAVRTHLLPYPHADRLVIVTQATNASQELSPTWLNFLDWKEQSHSFELMAVDCLEDFTVTGAADAERIHGQIVTSDFLPLFGAQTLLGRGFRREDDAAGANPTAILEYSFWRRRFASDPTIVGKPITLNNTIFTIVGVLPESFHYYHEGEIFLPIGAFPDRMALAGTIKGWALPQDLLLGSILRRLGQTWRCLAHGLPKCTLTPTAVRRCWSSRLPHGSGKIFG